MIARMAGLFDDVMCVTKTFASAADVSLALAVSAGREQARILNESLLLKAALRSGLLSFADYLHGGDFDHRSFFFSTQHDCFYRQLIVGCQVVHL